MQYILCFLWQEVTLNKRGWSLVMRFCRYRTRLCRVSHASRPGHSSKVWTTGRLHSSLREEHASRAKLYSKALIKIQKKKQNTYWTTNFESTLNYAKTLFQALRKCLQLLKITNHNFLKAGFPVASTNEFSLFFLTEITIQKSNF